MAAPAPTLVGRADELARLEDLLTELAQGRSAALEVAGEPGIGKTRLLAELSRRADARGFVVLGGCGAELQRDLPFWIFVDALDEYVEGLPADVVEGLDDEVRAELALVLPAVTPPAAGRAAADRDERYRTHHAVRQLLGQLASRRPLALVLDDAHWADPASVELLGALLRRPPPMPVLVAVAVRPRQLPPRLAAALDRERRAGALLHLELVALTRQEADDLLGADVPAEAQRAVLFKESGGNPFYLEQLARSIAPAAGQRAGGTGIQLAGVEVPPTVAAALTEELALLSDGARRVLEGAAVVGDPFEPEIVAAAAATSEEEAVLGLDEMVRVDLIRHTEVPRRFRFRHPLVGRAVYEAAPAGWRLGAHERSAAALADRGGSPAAYAHHVELSGRHGDVAAVAILRGAGQDAVNRAPHSAARWFGGALRLLPDMAPAAERVELLLARAGALAASGQYAEAHAVLLESLALLPESSLGLRVKLTAACAGVEHLLGRHDEAHARLHGALSTLDDPTSPEAIALMLELATDGLFRLEFGPMREWGARALAAARPLGQPPLTAAAAAGLAFACALDGAIPEGQTHRSEAAALVDAMTDADLAVRLDAPVYLGGAELYLDRFREAESHLERAIAVGRATGQTDIVPLGSSILGWVRMVLGQLAEGGEMLDGAVEGARLSGHDQTLAANLLNRSLMALTSGDLEMALVTANESYELTRPMGQSLVTLGSGLAYGSALLEAGDAARAVEVVVGRCGGEELPLIPGSFRSKWLELLTRCWLALGRRADAASAARRAEAWAAPMGLGMATALARRASAAVALDAGDPAGAAELALASAAAADSSGVVIEAALSRILAGRALARIGQRRRAVAELERAAGDLLACGAVRYRREAERELRRLGRRFPGRGQAGMDGAGGIACLTRRELEVARLIVDRKTNAQIAGELFLSRKTVETHIRNIFRKLAVSSRVQIAKAIEDAEREPVVGARRVRARPR